MDPLQALKIAATTAQVSFDLLRAICTVESGLNPKALNPKDGGSASHGMCQIKYTTAKTVGYRGTEKELYNVKTNALYAAKYLKYQLQRYKGDWLKATSAYNRGSYHPSNHKYVKRVVNVIIKETLDGYARCQNQKYSYCTRRLAYAF